MLVTVASELRMVIVMSALRIGVIRMKNKEKYSKEIVEIACKGHNFRVDKNTNEVADCCDAPCAACLFLEMDDCDKARREWAESEYIEKPVIVISKRDRVLLEYIRERYKYISRDENGNLFAYETHPKKVGTCWNTNSLICKSYLYLNRHFNVDFPMIKWADSEPWLIEDLKKLEVVDSYE